jgi:hypothetical protein
MLLSFKAKAKFVPYCTHSMLINYDVNESRTPISRVSNG